MRARRTDRNHAAIRQALRDAGCFVRDLSSMGKGLPDLLAYNPAADVLAFVEVKVGDEGLTPAQVSFFQEWAEVFRRRGVGFLIVRSEEEAMRYMGCKV